MWIVMTVNTEMCSKTKVMTTANQKKGRHPEEPMRTQSKSKQTAWARENAEDKIKIGLV